MDISEIKDFPVNTKSLREVREFSREVISRSSILEESKEELVLAIGEAAQNIVKHAYKAVSYTHLTLPTKRIV